MEVNIDIFYLPDLHQINKPIGDIELNPLLKLRGVLDALN